LRIKQITLLFLALIMLLAAGCSAALPNNQVKITTATEGDDNQNNKRIEGDPVKYRIATLTQGSPWYVYGATMAEVFRKNMPKDSVFDVLPYASGIGNAQMIAEKEAELALSFSVTNKWAYEGNQAYDKKYDSIRALAGDFDQYYVGIVMRKDFTDKYGIESIKDLKEKKIPVRLMAINVGSLGEFATRQIFEQSGLTYEDVKKNGGSVSHTTFDVIQQAFQDGRADMMIQVITKGHQAFSEIALTTPVKFMPIDDDVIEKLEEIGYEEAELPAGGFRGQDEPVKTVGFSTVLIANDDFPEEQAYNITKLISENKASLATGHKALGSFNPEEAWKPDRIGIPLHPGAEKYYKEKGWLK
jgi:TRAP transporter TAXI family solute receptor